MVAAGVLAALDAAGVEEFTVVGLSMGGYTAFPLLRLAGARVRSLVLCDTRARGDNTEEREGRMAMIERVQREGVGAIVEPTVARLLAPASQAEFHISDPVRGRIRRCTAEGVIACQRAMAGRADSTAMLREIGVPVTVIVGSEDVVVTAEEMRSMAAGIPGARFEVIEGAGHLSNLERWEAFNAALPL